MQDTTKVPSLMVMVNTAYGMIGSGSDKRIITGLLKKIVTATRGNAVSHRTAKKALRFYRKGQLAMSKAQLDATRRFIARGKSMNIAQKEAHVLKSAKRYRVKGGSARQLVGEIRKDANVVRRLINKDDLGSIKKAMQIIKKYQTHPLYKVLGIEQLATRDVRYAKEYANDVYRHIRGGGANSRRSERDKENVSRQLMELSHVIQREYNKRGRPPRRHR